ncbi:mitochondrial carrier domain-containing protein [Polychytrium aggregatum]|uniref:mitochondrial carrier domain-containing protein n=1 Tax=Polychytrium aggregatum TaxID=110093 RepID=UPI0022FF1C83|nr:mitochondrial carrier domain-containing protein [Polychytrium aggregatum]KAI9208193.1 mitochondrial carrier domain-containing protein [Polychytrium aggregatum]
MPEQHAAAASSSSKESMARVLGSIAGGLLELLLFHPVDTIAKRLMASNQTYSGLKNASLQDKLNLLDSVMFHESAGKAWSARYKSLYPGLGFAMFYKVTQRCYQFAGQPLVRNWLDRKYKRNFDEAFGKRSLIAQHAVAGAITGTGEVMLLPLDAVKVKRQTDRGKSSLPGLGSLHQLYRGSFWAIMRNATGASSLFGFAALGKELFFGLSDYRQATLYQNFVSSLVASVLSITIVSPFDVVKTRIQAAPLDRPQTGRAILHHIVVKEGFWAFFRGLTPKLIVAAPKITFTFTVAQTIYPSILQWLEKQ